MENVVFIYENERFSDYLLKYNKIKIFNVVFTVTVNGKDKIDYFADQWARSYSCMRKNNVQW